MKKTILAIFLILTLLSFPTFANGIFNSTNEVFKLNPYTDTALLVTGVGLSGASFMIKPTVPAFDGNLLNKNNVNAFDRLIMRPYSKSLDLTSTILEGTALLFPAVLMSSPLGEWGTIGTMYAETVLITYGTKELFKIGVDRARPYMYFNGYPQSKVEDGDYLDSFFSGHSGLAFASATFASYVFCKYNPDSKWKAPVIATSYTLAGTVASLRLASGNHFLSDVLTGAVFGSAVGFLVPWVHTIGTNPKTPQSNNVSMNVLPMGLVVNFEY